MADENETCPPELATELRTVGAFGTGGISFRGADRSTEEALLSPRKYLAYTLSSLCRIDAPEPAAAVDAAIKFEAEVD